jgi:hypothetical protein
LGEKQLTNMKNRKLFTICTFLLAIMMCGAVSASGINFSSDGKTLTIIPNYVPSTLHTTITPTVKNGPYGYGQYVTLKVTGKDIKGVNNNINSVVYNGVVKTITAYVSQGSYYYNGNMTLSATKGIMKIAGNDGPSLKILGSGTVQITNVHGQQILNNAVKTLKYYLNGKLVATVTSKTISSYKSFHGTYQNVKDTITSNTVANNYTRTSVITEIYYRNTNGVETGMNVAGTAHGTEQINNKTVTYTSKINVGIVHDPKDVLGGGYTTGNYREVYNSSSPQLAKIVPLDAP